MTNIYERALEVMKPEEIGHWCSDLYLKVTPESRKLVNEYDWKRNVKVFIDNIENVPWYDIPFAYCGEDWRC